MSTKRLSTIEIAMPDDFPIESFEAIHARVVSSAARHEKATKEYYGAENGIAYRFRACCEYSEDYSSIGNPNFEGLHFQEKALFGFFVSGLSVIESFCYGAFMVGALIDQLAFPIADDKALRGINPGSTAKAYQNSKVAGEPLAKLLAGLVDDDEYKKWVNVRNVLAHRLTPGRIVGMAPSIWQAGHDIELTATATSDRRAWLAKHLTSLMDALDAAAAKYL